MRLWLSAAALVVLAPAWAQQSPMVTTRIDVGACGYFAVDGVEYHKFGVFTWQEGTKHFVAALRNGDASGGVGMRCTSSQLTEDPSVQVIVADRSNPVVHLAGYSWEYRYLVQIEGGPQTIRSLDGALTGFSCAGVTLTHPQPWTQSQFGYILVELTGAAQAGSSGGSVGSGGSGGSDTVAATPVASPQPGTYTSAVDVVLSSATQGATICYTTDGSTPRSNTPGSCAAGSLPYTNSPIHVSTTTTINAIATMAGLTNSGVMTAVYTIGTVGGCFDTDGEIWSAYQSVKVTASAVPPRGFAFADWEVTTYSDPLMQPSISIPLNGPGGVLARFGPAARVSFTTDPAGLPMLLDGTKIVTPFEAELAYGTTHKVGPVAGLSAPDNMSYLAWGSWSDGGAENHQITIDTVPRAYEYVLSYVPGIPIGFRTEPLGLKLLVDGSDRYTGYNFLWGTGSKHTIAAPAQQADATGRKFGFNKWSNDGPVEQEIVMAAGSEGLIAYYDGFGRLMAKAAPSSVMLTVDGKPCSTPCDVQLPKGQTSTIAAPASVQSDDGGRLDFQNWTDGAARERVWTSDGEVGESTANYLLKYPLNVTVQPAGAATVQFDPASDDGYFPNGTDVTVTVVPKPGFQFHYFDGDLKGGQPMGSLWMGQARNVTAVFDAVEAHGPASVRNAAAATADPMVAAGSLIMIEGPGLAPVTQQSDGNPLSQVIGTTTVTVEDRILPLVSIAPGQIEAVLPSDLGWGEHTLVVHNLGWPDVPAKITVQRSAPGLFCNTIDTRDFASALHEDGTKITADSPAKAGEIITLLGTGFGPYKQGALDGFILPEGIRLDVADPVQIRVGDAVLTPESVRAATGYAGTVAVRLKIAAPLPQNATVELQAVMKDAASGADCASNKVLLPLK